MQREHGRLLWGLATDTLIYGVSTALARLVNFLLTPLQTNVLAPAEFGEVSYLYALLAFVNIALSLGFESAYLRFAAEAPGAEQARVFTHAWGAMGLNALFWGVVGWTAAPQLTELLGLAALGSEGVRLAVLIAVCDAVTLIPLARLRLERQAARFAGIRLVHVLLVALGNVLFLLLLRWGARGVLWAGLMASATVAVVALPLTRGLLRCEYSARLLQAMVRYALPTVPAAFASIALQVADRPLLMLLLDARAVGIYQANYRLALPLLMMVSVFEYAWRPFFLRMHTRADAPELFARVALVWACVAAVGFLTTALLMPIIVHIPIAGAYLIPPTYWEGLGVVPIVAAAYGIYGLYICTAASAHIAKQTWWLALALGAGALGNVVLLFALVPVMGYTGAAWATLGAYGIATGVMLWGARRLYPVPYPWRAIVPLWALTGVVWWGGMQLELGGRLVLLAVVGLAVGGWGWWQYRRV